MCFVIYQVKSRRMSRSPSIHPYYNTVSKVVNVMMSKWIFSLIELKYRFSTPAAPERQRPPEDSASVPRPTHLAIPGERTGVAPELGER